MHSVCTIHTNMNHKQKISENDTWILSDANRDDGNKNT